MLTYFLLTNLSLCLLYAVYWLFLRRETFSHLNRTYLLVAVILSLVIPAAEFPKNVNEAIDNQVTNVLPTISILQESKLLSPKEEVMPLTAEKLDKSVELSYFQLISAFYKPILLFVYLAGVLFFLIRFLESIWKLYHLISKHEKKKEKGYFLIEYEGNHGVFSFLNYLFWSKQMPYSALIMKHELAHIRQKHTFDILFFELMSVAFWYNPMIHLYQKSARLVHEYLADEAVTAQIASKTDYAQTLLAYATQKTNLSIAHHFSYPQTLKQRIMKIYQEKSKKKASLKYLFALPALLVCLLVVACEKQTFQAQTSETSEVSEVNTKKAEIDIYAPLDFQEKIAALQAEDPNHRFIFQIMESKFLQKELDNDADDTGQAKMVYYRPISVAEGNKYMEGQFAGYMKRFIDEHGEDSEVAKLFIKNMKPWTTKGDPMIGYIYRHSISKQAEENSDLENEDITVYTEVDELPTPRDGEAFYKEIAQLIKLSDVIKAENLEGDMVLEMIVTKTGQITKANIIEEIQVKTPKELEKESFTFSVSKNKQPSPFYEVNGVVYRAFMERSNVRGWKAGIKNGKRVDTKIRFKIPVKLVKERC